MGDDEKTDAVKIALLERDNADMKGRIDKLTSAVEQSTEALRAASRKPPTFEVHDDVAHVGCPNCGTARDVQLPQAGSGVDSFDDVIALMDSPHREAGGKKVTDCPSCKPKFEAKLKELGYGPIAPVPIPED